MTIFNTSLPTPRRPQRDVRFQGHQNRHDHRKFSEEEAQKINQFLFEQEALSQQIIDHEVPRGRAHVPGWSEMLGDKASKLTVGIDFLPFRAANAMQSIGRWTHRQFSATVSADSQQSKQAEQHRQDAEFLTEQILQKVDLSEVVDVEQGFSQAALKSRLIDVLAENAKLRYVVRNALSGKLAGVAKHVVVAKPDLEALTRNIIAWEGFWSDDTETSSSEEGAAKLEQIAQNAQSSAALTARSGKQVANWLRTGQKFQIRPLGPDEAYESYLRKTQYPPLKNPYEFMAIKPGESNLHVSNRFQNTPDSRMGQLLQAFKPYPRQSVLDTKMPLTVVSSDPNAQLMVAALMKGHERDFPKVEATTPVFVRIRDTEQFKKEVFQPIVNTFRITEPIEIKDRNNPGKTRKIEIKEACLWPLIEGILAKGEQGLGPNCTLKNSDKKCFDLLADSNIYEFSSPDKSVENFLNQRLHDKQDPHIRTLKARLAALQVAGLQYAEQVNVAETVATFAKGAAIGVLGEKLSDKIGGGELKPGENVFTDPGFWTRVGFLGLIDSIDNWYGEHGVLDADLKGMGLSNTKKDVFGNAPPPDPVRIKDYLSARKATNMPESIDQFRRRLLLAAVGDADGKAATSVATLYRSVALGGAGGLLASLWAAKTFTEQNSPLVEKMFSTSVGTLGALSIPINFALTLPRVMSSLNEHIEEGRLVLPDTVDKRNPKAVKNYILEMALQDMMCRTGMQASLKAYNVIPLLGTGWVAEKFLPESFVQTVLFSGMPIAENITRGGFMLDRVSRTFPKVMNNIEGSVLAAYIKGEPDMERYRHFFRSELNGSWSKLSSQGMNYVTYPLQALMTSRRHIDYHRPLSPEERV